MQKSIIVGIDLAGIATNPTGWALLRNKAISIHHLYHDEEILKRSTDCRPQLIAVDAPLSLPKKDTMREADREMHKRGYPVLPPCLPAMKKLTLRAVSIVQEIKKRGFNVIEVHPTSTRKALKMPTKDWKKTQAILKQIGLKGDLETRVLTPHEIDAVTAALTGHLHLQRKTELIGDEEKEYIVVPTENDWRRLRL